MEEETQAVLDNELKGLREGSGRIARRRERHAQHFAGGEPRATGHGQQGQSASQRRSEGKRTLVVGKVTNIVGIAVPCAGMVLR